MSPSTAAAPWERAAALLGCRARRELPLGPRTTYRVGGAARVGWSAETVEDLHALAAAVSATGVDVLVVGNGSNLLVADGGFDGVALVLGEGFAWVAIDGDRARAGGATALPVVARRTAAAGLTGFEWAVGVPGSIGGAVRMNAGGHGSDMAACLATVSVLSLADPAPGPVPLDPAALDLRYRRSSLRADQVVTEVSLALSRGDAVRAGAAITEIVRWRRANQPGGQNAGSVFTNPLGDSAGRLIDAAGCKGLRAGTAEVSTKHANFIQADAGGSADDVVALMAEVRRRVVAAGGPALVPETRLVGFGADVLAALGVPSGPGPDRAPRPDASGRTGGTGGEAR